VAQSRDKWQSLADSLIDLRFPQNGGTFLTT
jgi:hypothetical protein